MKLPEKGITGIYKITNPKGRVYIGQAKCIRGRWQGYKSGLGKGQPKLKHSISCHGIDKHTFEIIHECEVEELNKLERYYQELYNCIDEGLNCVYVDENNGTYERSEEFRKSISKNRIEKGISKGKNNPRFTPIIGVNKINGKVLEMGVYEWADFLKCDPLIIRNKCETNQLVQRKGLINDWDLDYKNNKVKNKPINFGDLKIFLDIYTGIYFYGRQDLADYLNISINQLRWLLKKPNSELYNRIKIV